MNGCSKNGKICIFHDECSQYVHGKICPAYMDNRPYKWMIALVLLFLLVIFWVCVFK